MSPVDDTRGDRKSKAASPVLITDPEERRKHVEGLYQVDATQTPGRNILLFDDLFRSGTTMNEITGILLNPGQAAVVRALTITKTRSNH